MLDWQFAWLERVYAIWNDYFMIKMIEQHSEFN